MIKVTDKGILGADLILYNVTEEVVENVELLDFDKIQESLKSEGYILDVNDIIIEKSKTPEHGDYASNVALKFGGRFKVAPRDLAAKIAENIEN